MRIVKRRLWRYMVASLFNVAACCSPFTMDSNPRMGVLQAMSGITNNQLSASDGPRARGMETLTQGLGHTSPFTLGVSSVPPISHSSELDCFDFDKHCRWRNIEGFLVDEMDWYQGTGQLDKNRIQRATGANTIPDGSYAIVATDTSTTATAKAVLAADPIPCQIGAGELSFKFWTSPQVRIRVCVRRNPKLLLDFDYCSNTVEIGDPGPVSVRIPQLSTSPFQLFIIADHFTFNSSDLQGGFAIIDDIQYTAEICSNIELDQDQPSIHPFPSPPASTSLESAAGTGWHDGMDVATSEGITPMRFQSRV
uniref:MAM domain-containing protein n=1 Tax=Haemonchus contortus TaxID=6289 RepID=A0A7I4XS74_HAECO